MKIRYKYSQLPHMPDLESMVHGQIEKALNHDSDFEPEINVSFESGKYGNRVRIRVKLDRKCIIRISGQDSLVKDAAIVAIKLLRIEVDKYNLQDTDCKTPSSASNPIFDSNHSEFHSSSKQRWPGYLH